MCLSRMIGERNVYCKIGEINLKRPMVIIRNLGDWIKKDELIRELNERMGVRIL